MDSCFQKFCCEIFDFIKFWIKLDFKLNSNYLCYEPLNLISVMTQRRKTKFLRFLLKIKRKFLNQKVIKEFRSNRFQKWNFILFSFFLFFPYLNTPPPPREKSLFKISNLAKKNLCKRKGIEKKKTCNTLQERPKYIYFLLNLKSQLSYKRISLAYTLDSVINYVHIF